MATIWRKVHKIYQIYLKYVAPEDIHSYSIDEVFIDLTSYLETYHMSAHELTTRMIRNVQKETGITATAGIGTNLYLAKIAMILWQSTSNRTRTECVSQNWMR